MKRFFPSPFLSQNTLFFGLNTSDMVALALILIVSQKLGAESIYKGLPIIITILSTAALIPIRMRYQRGTIRGFIKYWGRYACFRVIKYIKY